jgi:hypothetical protein
VGEEESHTSAFSLPALAFPVILIAQSMHFSDSDLRFPSNSALLDHTATPTTCNKWSDTLLLHKYSTVDLIVLTVASSCGAKTIMTTFAGDARQKIHGSESTTTRDTRDRALFCVQCVTCFYSGHLNEII